MLHEGPEQFLTMMVLDGVFLRHPTLRGASVELGAGWVPELLRRLDWVVKHWSRSDANLQAWPSTPSEQLTRQLAFTPFDLCAFHAHRLRGHGLVQDVHPAEEVAELEAAEHLA